MTDTAPSSSADAGRSDIEAAPRPSEAARRWRMALVLAFGILLVLDWLLARLIWLPFYFGLFFFLVAGMLAGACSFRLACPARPVSRGRILLAAVLISGLSGVATTIWEYRDVVGHRIGERRFTKARNTAISERRPMVEVDASIEEAFTAALRADYPPGGPIGYVRWAVSSGEMTLTVLGCEDTVSIDHRGLAWMLRTLAAVLLVAVGLWLSFESLRSPVRTSNILVPGEEAED